MFPDEELRELKDRISQMSDRELLQIVEVEYDDYRKEAIELAQEELTKRSIPFETPELDEDVDQDGDSFESAGDGVPCKKCGGETRLGSLFADKELTILFPDTSEERFVIAVACTNCGDIRLTVDLHTDVEG
jgi:hypothetical protein